MTVENMMVLQNCTDIKKEVRDELVETYPVSHDASQAMNIKVEEFSDIEEEEDPVPITFPEIKVEPEVSCTYLYVYC
jgi:hypothetical protein